MTPVMLVVVKVLVFIGVVLLSKPLSLRLSKDGKPHAAVGIVWWAIGIAGLVAEFLATDINDDEVYWLTNAWAQTQGLHNGTAFLRGVLFEPFLWLGLGSGATVVAGRVCFVVLAGLCAWLASSIARRMGQSALVATLIGPLLLLWFAQMPMVFVRPEYIAFVFFMIGLWVLMVPPTSWSRQTSIFLSFILFALCSTTSLRLVPFPIGALVCVVLYPGGISRGAAAKWAILGGLVGIAPTVLWTVFTDSIRNLYYWNFIFPKQAEWLSPMSHWHVPPVLLGLAVAGSVYLLINDKDRASSRTLIILWLTVTALAWFNPQKYGYTLGPWLALSGLVGGRFLSLLPEGGPSLGKTRWTIIAFSVMGLPLLAWYIGGFSGVNNFRSLCQERNSQLRLIDWIEQTSSDNPVICVCPYQPIRAKNTWGLWNAWWYADVREHNLLTKLDPGIEGKLWSGEAAVILWDPWPERSGSDNVMQFWDRWGLIGSRPPDQMASRLADHYVPVRWKGPLPERYGGGTFLVRKDVKPAPGVARLDSRTILDWRKKAR